MELEEVEMTVDDSLEDGEIPSPVRINNYKDPCSEHYETISELSEDEIAARRLEHRRKLHRRRRSRTRVHARRRTRSFRDQHMNDFDEMRQRYLQRLKENRRREEELRKNLEDNEDKPDEENQGTNTLEVDMELNSPGPSIPVCEISSQESELPLSQSSSQKSVIILDSEEDNDIHHLRALALMSQPRPQQISGNDSDSTDASENEFSLRAEALKTAILKKRNSIIQKKTKKKTKEKLTDSIENKKNVQANKGNHSVEPMKQSETDNAVGKENKKDAVDDSVEDEKALRELLLATIARKENEIVDKSGSGPKLATSHPPVTEEMPPPRRLSQSINDLIHVFGESELSPTVETQELLMLGVATISNERVVPDRESSSLNDSSNHRTESTPDIFSSTTHNVKNVESDKSNPIQSLLPIAQGVKSSNTLSNINPLRDMFSDQFQNLNTSLARVSPNSKVSGIKRPRKCKPFPIPVITDRFRSKKIPPNQQLSNSPKWKPISSNTLEKSAHIDQSIHNFTTDEPIKSPQDFQTDVKTLSPPKQPMHTNTSEKYVTSDQINPKPATNEPSKSVQAIQNSRTDVKTLPPLLPDKHTEKCQPRDQIIDPKPATNEPRTFQKTVTNVKSRSLEQQPIQKTHLQSDTKPMQFLPPNVSQLASAVNVTKRMTSLPQKGIEFKPPRTGYQPLTVVSNNCDKRIVVNLGADSSDEETDDGKKLAPGDPLNLLSKVDDFLLNARRMHDASIPPIPEAVRLHLSPSQRLEYMRLTQKLAEKQKSVTIQPDELKSSDLSGSPALNQIIITCPNTTEKTTGGNQADLRTVLKRKLSDEKTSNATSSQNCAMKNRDDLIEKKASSVQNLAKITKKIQPEQPIKAVVAKPKAKPVKSPSKESVQLVKIGQLMAVLKRELAAESIARDELARLRQEIIVIEQKRQEHSNRSMILRTRIKKLLGPAKLSKAGLSRIPPIGPTNHNIKPKLSSASTPHTTTPSLSPVNKSTPSTARLEVPPVVKNGKVQTSLPQTSTKTISSDIADPIGRSSESPLVNSCPPSSFRADASTQVLATCAKNGNVRNFVCYISPLGSGKSTLDPNKEICPHDLCGVCKDSGCPYQHIPV